jgi:hypothetical protein
VLTIKFKLVNLGKIQRRIRELAGTTRNQSCLHLPLKVVIGIMTQQLVMLGPAELKTLYNYEQMGKVNTGH